MPTLPIDLSDSPNIPEDWDAQLFFVMKMYESGMISSVQVAQMVGVVPSAEDDDEIEAAHGPDSWFTLKQRKQFVRNRKRLAFKEQGEHVVCRVEPTTAKTLRFCCCQV